MNADDGGKRLGGVIGVILVLEKADTLHFRERWIQGCALNLNWFKATCVVGSKNRMRAEEAGCT